MPCTSIYQVNPPLTLEALREVEERCCVVQFNTSLASQEFQLLAAFLEERPEVTLRVYGDKTVSDLDFLRWFPFLRRLAIDVWSLESFEGLAYLSSGVERLSLGQTRSTKPSLRILERFPQLRVLSLEGHIRDIDALKVLDRLEQLTLRSITLPDLSVLKNLRHLWSLAIKLGGTKHLELLPEIGTLKYLELWLIRGLSDVAPIAEIRSLQYLFLQALRNVRALPSFDGLRQLRRLHLETMKGLQVLQSVSEAPALEELLLIDMPQLADDALDCFIGHPTLKAVTIGLGSSRRNSAVTRRIGLPRVTRYGTDFPYLSDPAS